MNKLVEVANLGYTSLGLTFNDGRYLFEETIERLTDEGFDVIFGTSPFVKNKNATPLPNSGNHVTILWGEAAKGKKGKHL